MERARRCRGGIALEYVLVTTFATLATMILLGVLATIAKDKITTLAEKMEVDIDDVQLDIFGRH
ncbi:MAG: hypothetical protein HYW48_05855 [Deltaproteobacteria bacterium]|nr:hypothetical protein [Deltaproteobacteria bacterium]